MPYSSEHNGFDKWVLTKDLEKGISIVEQMNKGQIVLDRFDDILLSAIAIDASLGLLQASHINKSKKKTMKHTLRSWMVKKKFAFKEVQIDEGTNSRFSQNGRDLYVRNIDGGGYRLYSCSYVKCEDREDYKDQTLMNAIFVKEFNRRWEEGIIQLHKKLEDEFGTKIAEAKSSVTKDEVFIHGAKSASFGHKEFQESKEAKSSKAYFSHKESKCYNNEAEKQNHEKKMLTAEAYGISSRRFSHRLSFAKRTLIQLERDIEEEAARKKATKKEEREAGAKSVHEHWVDKKDEEAREEKIARSFREQRQRRYKSALSIPSLQPRAQEVHKGREKKKDKVLRTPSMPKIWAEESGEGIDGRLITIHWDTDDTIIDWFILSMYNGEGKSRLMQWRYEESKKLTLSLRPGSYCFGVHSSSEYGESPEAKIYVSSKPFKPGGLVLRKASEYSLELQWEQRDAPPVHKDDIIVMPKITGTFSNAIYNVIECCVNDENDEWEEIWRGPTNSASIGGLIEDSSYKLRVQSRSSDLSSLYGESKVFYTLVRSPKSPRVKNIGTKFVDLCFDEPESITSDGRRGDLSLTKAFRALGNFLHITDLDKMNDLLGIPGISKEEKEIMKGDVQNGNVFRCQDLIHLWANHLIFILYQEIDGDVSNRKQVTKTKDYSYRVNDLLPNSTYSFRIRCKTLRCYSVMGPPLTVTTLPECPTGLYFIHIDSNEIIVKVNGSSFGAKLVMETKEEGKNKWKQVYVGRKSIVKISNLRQYREYDVKAHFVNVAGAEGDFINRSTRTLDTPFVLKSKTIATLFHIDCQDIVEGDMILFSELYDSPSCTGDQRSIAARVVSLKDLDAVPLEVAWVSTKDITIGAVIERDSETLNQFEVLRISWEDEAERNAY